MSTTQLPETAATVPTPDHELEDGCRPTTPRGDNLLLDFARAEAAAYGAIARSNGGRVESVAELGLHMTDGASASPFGNVAHLTAPLRPETAGDVVAALRGFYAAATGGPFLFFSPWPTGDLSSHGLALAGHPPFMVRARGGAPATADGLRIVQVTTAEQLADFEQTLVEAYPSPELAPFGSHPRLFGDGVVGSAWKLYVGYESDRPVATAGGFVGDGVVAVEVVSTRPECRGKGYGAAITAAATFAATDRPAALVASDPGRGVYERLGYLPVSRYTLWVGHR